MTHRQRGVRPQPGNIGSEIFSKLLCGRVIARGCHAPLSRFAQQDHVVDQSAAPLRIFTRNTEQIARIDAQNPIGEIAIHIEFTARDQRGEQLPYQTLQAFGLGLDGLWSIGGLEQGTPSAMVRPVHGHERPRNRLIEQNLPQQGAMAEIQLVLRQTGARHVVEARQRPCIIFFDIMGAPCLAHLLVQIGRVAHCLMRIGIIVDRHRRTP